MFSLLSGDESTSISLTNAFGVKKAPRFTSTMNGNGTGCDRMG